MDRLLDSGSRAWSSRAPFVAAGLLAAGTCLGAMASPEPRDELTARRLTITDAAGKSKIELWADESGAHLHMSCANAAAEVDINVVDGEEDEEPHVDLSLRTKAGETILNGGSVSGVLESHPAWYLGDLEGTPVSVVFDKAGQPRIVLSTSPSSDGHVLIQGDKDKLELTPKSK